MENYMKHTVKEGKLVELDTTTKEGKACSCPVVVTKSLEDLFKRSTFKDPAAVLLSSLSRTLNSYKFTGATPPRCLKVFASAKDNIYFESITIPWDESMTPCIVFALPGQIDVEEGSIAELSDEARAKFGEMTPEEHEKMAVLAIALAQKALKGPETPEKAKEAARQLLSINAARIL